MKVWVSALTASMASAAIAGCLGFGPPEDPHRVTELYGWAQFQRSAWDMATAESAVERLGFTTVASNETWMTAERGGTELRIFPSDVRSNWTFEVAFPRSGERLSEQEFAELMEEGREVYKPQFHDILARFENETGSRAHYTDWSFRGSIA